MCILGQTKSDEWSSSNKVLNTTSFCYIRSSLNDINSNPYHVCSFASSIVICYQLRGNVSAQLDLWGMLGYNFIGFTLELHSKVLKNVLKKVLKSKFCSRTCSRTEGNDMMLLLLFLLYTPDDPFIWSRKWLQDDCDPLLGNTDDDSLPSTSILSSPSLTF